ncbi:MAG: extracellular solute-binding protein family 1 [Bacilli bacterium]|nr:extracellular solute-binding protein family 1 [Bacilli bacterium]
MNQKIKLLSAISLTFVLVLAGCSSTKTSTETASPNATMSVQTPAGSVAPAAGGQGSELTDALAGKFKGKKVSLFGPFTDADQKKFEESVKDFETKSGIDIQYEGSKEFEATIGVRVDGGNPPDIADFPQPGLLANFVKKGKVIDLNKVFDPAKLKANYNQSWLDMATMDGSNGKIMSGVWNRSNAKGLVFYNKKTFTSGGYAEPKTWDEMITLSKKIASDGIKPWSLGIESGAATGWVATDWVESIMLRTTTPENYDKWVKGEIKFTDDIVKNAIKKMSDLWFDDSIVYGGRKAIPTTNFGDAAKPIFANPSKAMFINQGNFISSFFPEGSKPGTDYDFFVLPSIDPQYGTPVEVGGDLYAMFNDRPEVRAVIQFFSTGESIKSWIQSGGVIAPMNDASLDWYTNDVDRKIAKAVQGAKTLRFDGSDLMPGVVGAGSFWKGMTDYVSGTVDLDGATKEIQGGWANVK